MASSRKARGAELDALERHVVSELNGRLPRGATVTVALSGGLDSIVLLEALRRTARVLGIRLRALHVNHGLSPRAGEWERFCRLHCARRRVPFRAVRVEVAGEGANLEAQARAARYQAFAQSGSRYIVLAHHRDDQAETLLLNLLRGSGVHGLAAMPPARVLEPAAGAGKQVQLLRPLLAVARAELAQYARQRRLRWVEDESNRDVRFARNFVRHEVLPLLEQRFPAARETLARSAEHLRATADVLDAVAAADCEEARADGGLSVARLAALGEARAANALRHLLARAGEAPPSHARTREILRQLTAARRDAQPAIELGTVSVRRFRGRIELVRRGQAPSEARVVPWHGEKRVPLEDGSELVVAPSRGEGVSARRLESAPVAIRSRRGGERMRIAPTGRSRTLKNLLQEAGVAPWLRAAMPLVYCGESLVWAPFVGVAAEFRAQGGERAWRFAWHPEGAPEAIG